MIKIDEYDYDLPEDRIAQYPVGERDLSKLLVMKGGLISQDTFRNIGDHIPPLAAIVMTAPASKISSPSW
jgi:S-adenosylmethionine:tRNA ribosyltransferase-isomerase